MRKPLIAIVGRANAGKSTLFNRLVGRRKAIVHNRPGITRDRNYADIDYEGKKLTIVDTGGFETSDNPELSPREVTHQVKMAIADADVILLMVDGRQPLTAADEALVDLVRRSGKPAALCVNKIDGPRHEPGMYDYYRLGFEAFFPTSAEHGQGVGDLMEHLLSRIANWPEAGEEAAPAGEEPLEVAIVGKPNVGKSTLVNKLLGYERCIVSKMPGTTRDALDTPFTYHDRKIVLVDTAGIRRRRSISDPAEHYSVQRAFHAIDRARVAVFLLDATESISEQDKRVASYAHNHGRASVIVANKWDLAKGNISIGDYEKAARAEMRHLTYAPFLTISAKSGQRAYLVLDAVLRVAAAGAVRVPTPRLNQLVTALTSKHPPPFHHNRPVKLYYGTQTGIQPPRFVIFCNYPEGVNFAYRGFITNNLREAFGFEGNPVELHFRARPRSKSKLD